MKTPRELAEIAGRIGEAMREWGAAMLENESASAVTDYELSLAKEALVEVNRVVTDLWNELAAEDAKRKLVNPDANAAQEAFVSHDLHRAIYAANAAELEKKN